jgi:hypothetical protein
VQHETAVRGVEGEVECCLSESVIGSRGQKGRGRAKGRLTVRRKKVMKCRPLSLWPYCGILLVERPR